MIVITGASSGLGESLAYEYAQSKKPLCLIARRKDRLLKVKEKCLALGSPEVRLWPLDLKECSLFRDKLKALELEVGIEIFVANAGINLFGSTINDDCANEAREIFEINTLCVIDQIEFLKTLWIKNGSSSKKIAVVSSISKVRGLPEAGIYCASKAAISTYLESIRIELDSMGIKIIEFAPGFMETEMTSSVGYSMPFKIKSGVAARLFKKSITQNKFLTIHHSFFRPVVTFLNLLSPKLYHLWGTLFMRFRGGRNKATKT